jgi:hypothetical protein
MIYTAKVFRELAAAKVFRQLAELPLSENDNVTYDEACKNRLDVRRALILVAEELECAEVLNAHP